MKFKMLLLSMILISGCQKEKNTSLLPSSWIGKIKMGDATPELVFNIFKDSLGNTAGGLGIPSKGIKDIPLDNIEIKQDSIILEISIAQASFKGIFIENKKSIKGIWKEGLNTFPLILMPLNKVIDYDNFKKENTSSLDLKFKSEHFNFYSKKNDIQVLESLSTILENNYLRITKDMQTHFKSKVDVFIYPDLKSFHNAINYPEAPDWVVGAASKSELKMVSPLNPGSAHSYESLMKAIVHELAHTVVLNYRKQGLAGIPNWLNEGYAYYTADQLTEDERKVISSNLLKNKTPTWDELERASNFEFGDMGGYRISATIIEFLIKSYGLDKLKQFINTPNNVNQIYGMPKKDLEILWLEFLNKKANS